MPSYLLQHQHAADECASAFAAWSGFASPLRHQPTASTCLGGGHCLVWRVSADDARAALELLPVFVRERTTASAVRDVEIP